MKNYQTCAKCFLTRNVNLAPECVCRVKKGGSAHLNPYRPGPAKQPFVKGVCRYCFVDTRASTTVCDDCRSKKAVLVWERNRESVVK